MLYVLRIPLHAIQGIFAIYPFGTKILETKLVGHVITRNMVFLLTTYHFRLKYACLKILQGCHSSTCVPNYEISIEELCKNRQIVELNCSVA